MKLCNHPNEVPHVCTCVLTCGCRSTTCPPTTEERARAREVFQELGQAMVQGVDEEPQQYIVRLFDMFDGWMDISGPLFKEAANAVWNQKTANGTKNTKFQDGDYYRVFPADTLMLMTPEFLGR